MRNSAGSTTLLAILGFVLFSTMAGSSEAGDRLFRRRVRPVVETVTVSRPENEVAPSPMLGQFRPTPYVTVGGLGVRGGGYSPVGAFGRENSLAVYGPLSAFRTNAAPVATVVRGYDGLPVVVEGNSFSNPNLPALSPVVYPTRASNYSALRYQSTPPQRDSGYMWIDQN